MNTLLIYPEFPDTFWSFKHALKFIRKRASSPPLGLLTVAAMLPPDWSPRLVDVNVTRLTETDLAWADYAFVSGMTVQRESAHQLIAQCKSAGVKVVAGGPLFASEHEQFLEVDHFVLNEAELTLPHFLAGGQQIWWDGLSAFTQLIPLASVEITSFTVETLIDRLGLAHEMFKYGTAFQVGAGLMVHDASLCEVMITG